MSYTTDEIYSNEFKLQQFIKHCTGPIPDELKFEGWQTSGKDEKAIHHWIKYRLCEPIPKDMKFKGWQISEG